MKILLADIETAPNIAYVWGLFKENIPIQRLISSGYILSWAAKWYGEDKIMFDSIQHKPAVDMLNEIHGLLDAADVVVHYNGSNFDIPTLNKEFVVNRMAPPSPYYQVDLLKVARNQFRFPSNKLAYVTEALGLTKKVEHIGWELWVRCMNGDPEAWKMMEEYNKGDIPPLEDLYNMLRPWIRNHPNHALYQEDKAVCPTCGGKHYHRRGKVTTRAGVYERYQCQSCGTWFRGNKNQVSPSRQNMLVANT